MSGYCVQSTLTANYCIYLINTVPWANAYMLQLSGLKQYWVQTQFVPHCPYLDRKEFREVCGSLPTTRPTLDTHTHTRCLSIWSSTVRIVSYLLILICKFLKCFYLYTFRASWKMGTPGWWRQASIGRETKGTCWRWPLSDTNVVTCHRQAGTHRISRVSQTAVIEFWS